MKSSIRHINDWLISAVLFVSVVFLIEQFRGNGFKFPSVSPVYLVTPAPSNALSGLASMDAIAVFRGDEPPGPAFSVLTLSILSSVLLYLIIGPALLYTGYKRSIDRKGPLRPWYWYVGSVLCIGGLTLVIVEGSRLLPNGNAAKNMQSIKESRALDQMRDELSDVSFAVAEYEIVNDGLHSDFSLDELDLAGLRFEYTLVKVEEDTLVTIRVEHPELEVNPQYMEVRPYTEAIMRMSSTYTENMSD